MVIPRNEDGGEEDQTAGGSLGAPPPALPAPLPPLKRPKRKRDRRLLSGSVRIGRDLGLRAPRGAGEVPRRKRRHFFLFWEKGANLDAKLFVFVCFVVLLFLLILFLACSFSLVFLASRSSFLALLAPLDSLGIHGPKTMDPCFPPVLVIPGRDHFAIASLHYEFAWGSRLSLSNLVVFAVRNT